MNRRPIIGVTTQTLHSIDGIPAGLPSSVVMNQRYYSAVADAGASPVLIPLLDDLDALRGVYDVCDGLLIPGGVDLDPACFGEPPHPKLGRTDPARDRVELRLTRWAIEDCKPLLGLCRGLQVINVALGGTLYQDIAAQCPDAIRHDYFPTQGFQRDFRAHEVTLREGSRIRHAMATAVIAVNSMHHQGIKLLAPALAPAAFAPDGLVEAAESLAEHFLVGVQWHPEVFEETEAHTKALFTEFIAQAVCFRKSARLKTDD